MSDEVEGFQTGFFGAGGKGPGKHTSSASDILDAHTINRLENAIAGLYSVIQAEGLYGPFRTETISGTITEYFSGDGVTTGFTLTRYIHKFQVYEYNIDESDPYINSVEPIGFGGKLSDFDDNTNTSNSFIFTTAPPTGVKNIKITYYIYEKYPSKLDSSAYLSDWS